MWEVKCSCLPDWQIKLRCCPHERSAHWWGAPTSMLPQGLEYWCGMEWWGHWLNIMESPDIQNQVSPVMYLPNKRCRCSWFSLYQQHEHVKKTQKTFKSEFVSGCGEHPRVSAKKSQIQGQAVTDFRAFCKRKFAKTQISYLFIQHMERLGVLWWHLLSILLLVHLERENSPILPFYFFFKTRSITIQLCFSYTMKYGVMSPLSMLHFLGLFWSTYIIKAQGL